MPIISLGATAAICLVDVAVAEQLVAPSLKNGAVISISNGLLSRKDAQAYQRKYRNSPDPCKIDIVVREVVPIGSIECNLDSETVRPTSIEGFQSAPVLMYAAQGKHAEFVLNAASLVSEPGTSYYLRNASHYKQDFLERGGGSGARIEFISCQGTSWFGLINGCFFSPQTKLSYQFKDAPFCMELPPEGSNIDELVAKLEKSSQEDIYEELAPEQDPATTYDDVPSPPQSEAATGTVELPALPASSLQEIIRKRLQLMVGKPVDVALMESFYAEKVTRISDGTVVNRSEIIDATRRLVADWPRRGVSLLGAGYNGRQMEIVVVFSFSDHDGNELAAYGKILLDFDDAGKVCGMSETITETKQEPSPGFFPVVYKGEKDVLVVEPAK